MAHIKGAASIRRPNSLPNSSVMNAIKFLLPIALAMALSAGARAATTSSAVPAFRPWTFPSPRILEEFPELLRAPAPNEPAQQQMHNIFGKVNKTGALALYPRAREQFPQLTRGGESSDILPSREGPDTYQFSGVLNNEALIQSPRTREEYPWLNLYQASPQDWNIGIMK